LESSVYIILLNWNGLNDTNECLQSLKKITYDNFEVVVVDNNSSGNDVNILKEEFGGFTHKIIVNDSNLGFSGGNNVGIKYAIENGADYILLLNNDTIVEPDFLDNLVSHVNINSSVGILTPVIKHYNNRSKIWAAGGKLSKLRGSGFASTEIGKSNAPSEVNFASGCALLIKREVFDKVGFLDENYFLYLEDTDFCYRTIKSGYKILLVPSSVIYHKINASTKENVSRLPLYYVTRNRLYFSNKNLGAWKFISITYIFFVSFLKLAIWTLANKRNKVNAIKRGLRDFINRRMGKLDSKI